MGIRKYSGGYIPSNFINEQPKKEEAPIEEPKAEKPIAEEVPAEEPKPKKGRKSKKDGA